MNKRNFLIASILSIFLCGMLLASVGAAHAKTITMYPKMDKTKVDQIFECLLGILVVCTSPLVIKTQLN